MKILTKLRTCLFLFSGTPLVCFDVASCDDSVRSLGGLFEISYILHVLLLIFL